MKKTFLLLSLLFFFFCCTENPIEEGKKDPITTGEVSEIKVVSAIINATLNIDTTNGAEFRIGVICSDADDPTLENGIVFDSNALKGNSFTTKLYNLKQNTHYYYRAFVYTGGLYHYGEVKSFTTKELSPKDVVTGVVIEEQYTQAKVWGSVDLINIGLEKDYSVYIAYDVEDPTSDNVLIKEVELDIDNRFETFISRPDTEADYLYCTCIEYQGGKLYGAIRELKPYLLSNKDVIAHEPDTISCAGAYVKCEVPPGLL